MNLEALAQLLTDNITQALPIIYIEGKVVIDKSKDMILEKCIKELGSKCGNKAKVLFDKISHKKGESLDKALIKVSENSQDSNAKEELKQEIIKLLRENPNFTEEIIELLRENPDFAEEFESIRNLNVKNIDQLAIGKYNYFFMFEYPSGEEYIRIIEDLNQRRREVTNQGILSYYNPSTLTNYPEKLKKFVIENRADELRESLTYIEKHRFLLISGVGGVGKTTLARAIIDLRPVNVPKPFWFSFYYNQEAKLGDILEKLADYMNTSEIKSFKIERRKPGKIDVDRLTDELCNRSNVWLIFDDLSMVLEDQQFSDKGIEILFSSLRYSTHNAKIIITSRISPIFENGDSLLDVLEDEERQHLNGLRIDFAVDYLASNGLDKVERKKLEELSKGVDGHPLALKLLVELVKKFGEADILEDLTIFQERAEDTIKKARRLFDKLAGEEKEFLERISVYREPVSKKGLDKMFTEKTPRNADLKLIEKSLLETDHKGNYWLHPLVKEFSYDNLGEKKEVHMLAVEYYFSLSKPENSLKKEDLQPFIEAHYHACMAKDYEKAFHIIFDNNINERLSLWGNYTVLIDLYSKMLPADHFGDELLLRDNKNHSTILGGLGIVYRALSEPEKAITYFEQAIKIAKRIGDKASEGDWLGNIGNVYCDLSQAKKAIGNYEQAIKIAEEKGDNRAKGEWLGCLGNAYFIMSEFTKAKKYHEQALEIAKEVEAKNSIGIWLLTIGKEIILLSEPQEAIEFYEKPIKMIKEEDTHNEMLSSETTRLKSSNKEFLKAIECFEQARKIAEENRNLHIEGLYYSYIGETHFKGNPKQAIEYFKKALIINKETSNKIYRGYSLVNFGIAYRYLQEPKKAIEYFKQAEKIAKEIKNKSLEEYSLVNLGNAYLDISEPEKAVESFEKARIIAKEIEDKRAEGIYFGNLGLAYYNLGEVKKAIKCYEEGLFIGTKIEHRGIINFCEENLKLLKDSKA